MNLTDFEFVMRDVPSLHTKRHAQVIYGLIRWLRPQVCVEVGAWMGYSTCWIARALQENGEGVLHAIDDFSLHTGHHVRERLEGNLERASVERRVAIIDGRSADVEWPERVDFAYIDGDHSLDGCRADFGKARMCGCRVVVIHDTVSWWGPRALVEEVRKSGKWDVIEGHFDEGLAVFVYREEKPAETYSRAAYPDGCV